MLRLKHSLALWTKNEECDKNRSGRGTERLRDACKRQRWIIQASSEFNVRLHLHGSLDGRWREEGINMGYMCGEWGSIAHLDEYFGGTCLLLCLLALIEEVERAVQERYRRQTVAALRSLLLDLSSCCR